MSTVSKVKHSSLYTKTGDKGQTSLYNGDRVLKNSSYCEAVGNLDELSSCLGLLSQELVEILSKESSTSKKIQMSDMCEQIRTIQSRLLDIGSHVATPRLTTDSTSKISRTDFSDDNITILEELIDFYDSKVPKLTRFILPIGHSHLARAVCRRAERSLVELYESGDIDNNVFIFINRLSDLLFAMGRYICIHFYCYEEIVYKKQ